MDVALFDEYLAGLGAQRFHLRLLDDLTAPQLFDLPVQVAAVSHAPVLRAIEEKQTRVHVTQRSARHDAPRHGTGEHVWSPKDAGRYAGRERSRAAPSPTIPTPEEFVLARNMLGAFRYMSGPTESG